MNSLTDDIYSSQNISRQVRCAIYTRKSTDEGLERDFNSLDAQRESERAKRLARHAVQPTDEFPSRTHATFHAGRPARVPAARRGD